MIGLSSDTIDLMAYFAAERDCVGYFRDIRGRQTRFAARFSGHVEGEALGIVEKMVYEDGTAIERIWTMNRDEGGWRAGAADIVGDAIIRRLDARTAIWDYRLAHPGARGTMELRLRDRMVLTAADVVASETRITKFAITIARVWALYVPAGMLSAEDRDLHQGLFAASSAISS